MSLTQEEKDTRVDLRDYDPIRDEHGNIRQFWKDIPEGTDPHHIWTGIACDDACDCESDEDGLPPDTCDCETFRIVAGFHYINRDYHIITRKPWVTGDEWE